MLVEEIFDAKDIDALPLPPPGAAVTVTTNVPVIPEPSVAEALTVTVPAPRALRSPVDESIVAVPVPFVIDQERT
ncbi:hypothetical protein A2554_02640 [Candidatus Nomurabacteria bacterium RIFOXYD2_FULL_35_12]|nr:MAG: hypothetical protein A2238_01465 [Candidatus Nomurabacteria bacterium RIFOXYA2_FULL_35_9]OGJ14647.1 MAG: hypothetical protein A2554_02640 [Candidatus Nomurabacteria bacterium RIFOXYD2_FULL_35_12]